jgi:hypothetical protein
MRVEIGREEFSTENQVGTVNHEVLLSMTRSTT